MSQLSALYLRILQILRAAPWSTAGQLARWVNRSLPRVYADLRFLMAQGLVQRVNPRSPFFDLRAVFALTDRGVKPLAAQAGQEERAYRLRYQISRQRYAELLWQLERVCHLRDFGLGLAVQGWRLEQFRVLVQNAYVYRMQERTLQFHACGRLVHPEGKALPFVVEWDSGKFAWEQPRLAQFAEWLDWFWYDDHETNFPMVLIVAANWERLETVWQLLHEHKQLFFWKYPALHLTTQERLQQASPHGAIWLDVERNHWKRWYEEETCYRREYWPFSIAARPRSGRIGKFESQIPVSKVLATSDRLLHLKLALSAQAKRVLLRVATRPLLCVSDVAWLIGEHPDRVGKALQELQRAGLVEAFQHEGTHRYILTRLGTRYEAAEQGFGRAVKHYLRRSGGRSGVNRLKYHLEHTIATNDFFLSWVRLARQQQVRFEWRSEIECARYFRRGSDWHRLLPDGEGVWHQGEQPFRFLVEMDRTRESRQNLAAKFRTYFLWQLWRESRSPWEPDPQLLFVTTSWSQAKVIGEVMHEGSYGVLRLYPLWLTTFEALARHGLDGCIWRFGPQSEGFYRLPCFLEPTPQDGASVETNVGDFFQS